MRLPKEVVPMLRAQVHDEIVLSVPIDVVVDVERAVMEALTFEWAPPGCLRQVPVTAGLGESRGVKSRPAELYWTAEHWHPETPMIIDHRQVLP